jgi:hypothetical protein
MHQSNPWWPAKYVESGRLTNDVEVDQAVAPEGPYLTLRSLQDF